MSLVPPFSPLSMPAAAKVVAIQALAAIGVVLAVARSLDAAPADAVWGVFAPIAAATAVLLLLFGWTQRGAAAGAAAESNTRFRAVFGLAPVGMLVIDAAGRVLEANAAFLAMMRSRPEDLVGRSVREFTHPDDWTASKPLRRDALAGRNDSYRVETRYLRSDGAHIWGRLSVAAMRDGDGVVRRWVAAIEDLTEARENEARFRSLAELTSDWFWEQDAELRFTRFWGRPLKLGALALDSLLGARPADSPHLRLGPERWAEHAAALRRHERFRELEIPVDAGDGRTYYLSLSGEPRFDANGAFAGYHGVARDVTAQRAAALETERQRALLRQVIDAVPSIVVLRDTDQRFVLCNRAFSEFWQRAAEQVAGLAFSDLALDPAERASIEETDRRVLAAGAVGPFEALFTNPRGDRHFFQGQKRLLGDSPYGRPLILTVLTDITALKDTEQAMRRSNEEVARQRSFLRQVLDAVPSAVAVRDSRHRYCMVNKARAALYGLTPKALVGRTDEELPRLVEEVRAQWRSDDQALASTLPLAPYEQALTLVDGEQRWFQVTKTRIAGIDGEADMVLTVATDLTERRRMEEELRESVERFRALVETLPVGVGYGGDTFEYANPEALRIFGYASVEAIRAVSPRQCVVESEQGQLEARLSRIAGGECNPQVMEYTIRRPNGETLPIEARGAPLHEAGRLLWLSVYRDLTESKRAEQALQRQRALLREVIDAVPGLIALRDRARRYVIANRPYAALWGFSPEQLIGRAVSDVVPAAEDEIRGCTDEEVLRTGKALDPFEVAHRCPDGQVRWYQVEKRLLDSRTTEEPLILSVGTDITARKEGAAALQRMNEELERRVRWRTAELEASIKELDAFSYTASHDLRQPLRAMNSYARIVAEEAGGLLPQEHRRLLRRIESNARRMADLLDALLGFSRLSRHALARHTVDPAALVHAVIAEVPRTGRNIEVRVGPLPPCEADPQLLRQVFSSLIDNAVKYTRPREIAEIEIGATVHDGETAYFVRDNGVGFDARYADKLFKVFERLHPGTDFEGSGVGLAIVQRIVRRHGGRVWAEGAPGAGATFYFSIGPAAAAAAA